MIPENIKREHILKAIEEVDKSGVPLERNSEIYDLEYNKKIYPPKYIVSLANKYANNNELDHSVFGGGDETNHFLQSLDFTIIKKNQDSQNNSDEMLQQELHDFAPRLKEYLATNYSIKVKKGSGRAHLSFPSGIIIHVWGSIVLKDARGFYYLQEKDLKDIIENERQFFAAVFGEPENTFVFPKEAVKQFFGSYPLTLQEGKKPKWYFDIRQEKDGSHYLKIHSGEAKEVNIDNYLNKWDQIDDFRTSKSPKSFLDLQRFLLTTNMRANYQPIMIRTLLLSSGKASKDSIALQIKELNSQESEQDFMNVPVYEVLERYGIVKKESNNNFVLNSKVLTSEERQQLIALCNWSINTLELQTEELINAFDKNKGLFDPDRLTNEEKERIRIGFVKDFPGERILEMQLNEYAQEKQDPSTGEVDKSTFCYRLEHELEKLSGIQGRTARKFGIYFSRTNQQYDYNKKRYNSPEEAFNAIKSEINTIIRAGSQFRVDKNWFSLSEKLEGDDYYDIHRFIRSKILSVYYPENFMQIHTTKHLAPIINAFKERSDDIKDKLFLMHKRVFEIKNKHPLMREWDNYDFSHFLWNSVIMRASRVYGDKSLEDGEIDEEEIPMMFITAYNGTNLEHSKRNSILGWKNNSTYLSQGALVFVYNTDSHKIESCFRVLSPSNNKNPIWEKEISGSSSNDHPKIHYPYRWDAELICDNLDIDLQAIDNITPFKGSINTKFLPITRNNYPQPLNDQKYFEFRNFLSSKCDNMKVHVSINVNEEQEEKYFILRTQPGSVWEDKEGQEYHYGTNVPRHAQLTPDSHVIFDRNIDGQVEYIGHAKISSVREEDKGRKTSEGSPVIDKVATLQDYLKFNPPVVRDSQIQKIVESIPNYNNQHSIRLITKEIFELITKNTFGNNQRLSSPGNWFSLSSIDIEEVIREVLDRDGIRLEIEPEIVKRIINHLISSKNVILVGPPGTGKTDLARRLLRVLGRKVIGKEEPVEAVASYEWGRYEVIGGNSLSQEKGNYIFHCGCVTKAIKEGKFLLIDEFNRADMNKAFGEMFLAVDHGRIELREDERPTDLIDMSNSDATTTTPFISVPSLFRMICTMNDYDKSILNDLSYGLLRRFAFVEIDIPKDRNALKDMIIQRIKSDLLNLDSDSTLDIHISGVNEITEKFIDFIYEISQMRKLGVSTILDVIRYVIVGIVVRNEQNYWKLFSEAMIDYVLPQFDRLDIDTLRHVKNTSLAKFTIYDSSESIPEIKPFLTNIEKMLNRLEELSDIFENK